MRCINNCGCTNKWPNHTNSWKTQRLCTACYTLLNDYKVSPMYKKCNDHCVKIVRINDVLTEVEKLFYLTTKCSDGNHVECKPKIYGFSQCRCECHEV